MVKETMKMEYLHKLTNLETHKYCLLNIKTGGMIFSNQKSNNKFTGLYFKDEATFFAIYPTKLGPEIYYNENVYRIYPELTISLKKIGKDREFCIQEYNIIIRYKESFYIGTDIWSEEDDIDLFFIIKQRYKSNEFYKQYTITND